VQVINRAIDALLIRLAGVKCSDVATGTITLIQDFSSAFRFRI
jgi:hypothetical protein